MKSKKIFLIITLTLLLVGIVNATESSNNTHNDDQIELTTPQEIENTNIETKTANKQINKKNITKNNIKTATKTYDVKNYNELHSALINKDYNSVTINIKSDITLNGNTKLNKAIKKLEINGNNKTINGNFKYQFLNIEEDNEVSIKNLIVKNCTALRGGAIISEYYSKLTITSCTFINNHAKWYGGAIYGFKVILKNCLFTKNTAGILKTDRLTTDFRGGAFYISNLNAKNCYFIDNHSNSDGGAISFNDGLIENCIFINNTAKSFGGAVNCGSYIGKYNIINSNFTSNYATWGGAIYGMDKLNVIGCIFSKNSAEKGSAIMYQRYLTKLNVTNNIFRNNYINDKDSTNKPIAKTSGTILNIHDAIHIDNKDYITKCDESVNNNLFNNNLPKTQLSLTLNKPYEGLLKASGKLTSNGKALANKTITINIDGKIIKVKTNSAGNYNHSHTITHLSSDSWNNKHNLIALYDGNGNYNPSAASKTFNVTKIKTKLTIIKITQKTRNGNMTITGRFTSTRGKLLINTQLKININGKNVTVKTDNNGLFKHTFKPNTKSLNKITVSYTANSKYAYAKAKITKTFNQTTKLTLNKIVKKNKVTYTGTFYSITGKKLINSKVKIKINGSVKTIKTNNKGEYKYTINNPKKLMKVRVYYDANSKYFYAPTSMTKTL
ncbi:MAG: hypothetical protein BZ138_01020 [Methanosphaera sp. rholeuAM270]|nr:MAG: hypothetical protein BZ138_01020 [Methanosphaera sp. rholeuAM270]